MGATLKDFSARTGFPVSTLSKLENGKLGMTYEKLLRLSRSLGIDIADLITDATAHATTACPVGKPEVELAQPRVGRREITRAGGGPVIETTTYAYRYPASDLMYKTLTPMFVDVTVRSIDDFDTLMRHPGDEYALVLEGAVMFHSDLYKPSRLDVGDSIYFDGNMGHAYVAAIDGPCRLICVCSAPDEELEASRNAFLKCS